MLVFRKQRERAAVGGDKLERLGRGAKAFEEQRVSGWRRSRGGHAPQG